MPNYEDLLKQARENRKKVESKDKEKAYPIAEANAANLLKKTPSAGSDTVTDVLSHEIIANALQRAIDLPPEDQEKFNRGEAVYLKKKSKEERTICLMPDPDPAVAGHIFLETKLKDAAGNKPAEDEIYLPHGATKTRKVAWDISRNPPVPYASNTYFIWADDKPKLKKHDSERSNLSILSGQPEFEPVMVLEREVRDSRGKLIGTQITQYSKFMPYNLADVIAGKWNNGIEPPGLDKTLVAFSGLMVEQYKIDIMQQLIASIRAMHGEGVNLIHADIKPENVLIDFAKDGKPIVKMIDFDLSDKPGSPSSRGSPKHVSPSQLIEAIAGGAALEKFYYSDGWTAIQNALSSLGKLAADSTPQAVKYEGGVLTVEETGKAKMDALLLFLSGVNRTNILAIKLLEDRVKQFYANPREYNGREAAEQELISSICNYIVNICIPIAKDAVMIDPEIIKDRQEIYDYFKEKIEKSMNTCITDRAYVKSIKHMVEEQGATYGELSSREDIWAVGVVFRMLLASNLQAATKVPKDVEFFREIFKFDLKGKEPEIRTVDQLQALFKAQLPKNASASELERIAKLQAEFAKLNAGQKGSISKPLNFDAPTEKPIIKSQQPEQPHSTKPRRGGPGHQEVA